ncbi:hypothetical protein [Cupriavidus sp. TMH.W2]|uniref:hypothetical protein n=1 Tax=Cupriavidus sp. TMH.W2 TaxID=3434465 RepID=UPI003D789A80
MTDTQPTIRIARHGGDCIIGLIMPTADGVAVVPRTVKLASHQLLDAAVQYSPIAPFTGEGKAGKLEIVTSDDKRHSLAELTFAACTNDRAIAANVQAAFTTAVFDFVEKDATIVSAGVAPSLSATVQPPTQQPVSGGRLRRSVSWLWHNKGKSLMATVVAFGACTVAYGYLSKPAEQAAFAGVTYSKEDQERLQEKIRKQVMSATADGSTLPGLDGTSVAQGTMRAMGLDPGKASAGCLVGVKR